MIQVVEDADAFALVLIRGLHQPHVLLAVLRRHPLLDGLAVVLGQVLESLAELMVLVSIKIRGDDESCRSGVEDLVTAVDGVDIVFVVCLETSDEASFGGDFSVVLQMVDDELGGGVELVGQRIQPLLGRAEELPLLGEQAVMQDGVDLAVLLVVEVGRLPDEVAPPGEGVLLRHLSPPSLLLEGRSEDIIAVTRKDAVVLVLVLQLFLSLVQALFRVELLILGHLLGGSTSGPRLHALGFNWGRADAGTRPLLQNERLLSLAPHSFWSVVWSQGLEVRCCCLAQLAVGAGGPSLRVPRSELGDGKSPPVVPVRSRAKECCLGATDAS